jgi:hypothetical protein
MKVVGVTEIPDVDALHDIALFVDSRGAWVLGPDARTITHIEAPTR